MKMEVKHKIEENKFLVALEGSEASLNYKPLKGNSLEILSTIIPKGIRGKGIGKELILSVLNYANTNNLRVVPTCPFVYKFIEMNSQYSFLTASP